MRQRKMIPRQWARLAETSARTNTQCLLKSHGECFAKRDVMLTEKRGKNYFHPDNMSSGEKQKIELAKVRDEFKMSKSDCGSARVQVAQLTTKIKHLSSVCTKRKTLNEPSNQFSSLAYMGHAVPWTLALTLLLTWRSGVIPWTLL